MSLEEIKEAIDLAKVLMDKLDINDMDESSRELCSALSYYIQVQENKIQ